MLFYKNKGGLGGFVVNKTWILYKKKKTIFSLILNATVCGGSILYLSPHFLIFLSLSLAWAFCFVLFCCFQPTCFVSQQSRFWAFLFHKFPVYPPPPVGIFGARRSGLFQTISRSIPGLDLFDVKFQPGRSVMSFFAFCWGIIWYKFTSAHAIN